MHYRRAIPRPRTPLLRFAAALRKQDIEAERKLWFLLRDRRFFGFKFRRQHPVEPYVLDFYCPAARLGIELDGSQHAENQQRDARRDAYLASHGIRMLRFWNDQLFKEQEGVLTVISEELRKTHPHP